MSKTMKTGHFRVLMTIVGGLAAGSALAPSFAGGPPFRVRPFDEKTGLNPHQYPPDLIVNYRHLKLEAKADMASGTLTCVETLTFTPIGTPVRQLTLDAVGMNVSQVSDGMGHLLSFNHDDGRHVVVNLSESLAPGREGALIFDYTVHNPPAGVYFNPVDSSHPGRPAMLYTQGEPDMNRYWLICHDYPNDRLTSEMLITAAKPNMVVSNGHLAEKKDVGDGNVQWHWVQDQPIVPYLIALDVGQWDLVEDQWNGKPVQYYVPLGRGEDAKRSFGRTPLMIEFFSRKFDQPFPWDKYAQVVVNNFMFGGMENASCTTLWEGAITDQVGLMDGDLDGLISHELAHQWFGDLMTCHSWDHIWLNEGFATYCADLWTEQFDGYDKYLLGIRDSMRGTAWGDRAGGNPAMVWNEYRKPMDAIFTPGANPYSKGASILHMLRCELGDEVFFAGIHEYIRQCKFTTVETSDFQRAMETASGRDLHWFFQQWCHRPGVPHLKIDMKYDDSTRMFTLHGEQTQPIDRDNPAFRFDLPITIVKQSKSPRADDVHAQTTLTTTLEVRTRGFDLSLALDEPPKFACVNANYAVLAKIDCTEPQEWLHAQMGSGPTLASRIDALEELARKDHDDAFVTELAGIVGQDKAPLDLRQSAAESLGVISTQSAHDAIRNALQTGIEDARLRKTCLEALGKFTDPRDVAYLNEFVQTELSYGCTAAVLRVLGQRKAVDHLDLFARMAREPSAQDRILNGVIDGLRFMDNAKALDMVIPLTAFGRPFRARASAIDAMVNLAKFDHERVYETLIGLLDDPEQRTVGASIDGLAALGDARAIPVLEKIAASSLSDAGREDADWAIDQIRTKNKGGNGNGQGH